MAQKQTNIPAWMVTYADLMSLLLCFFVLLLSFAEIDAQKFRRVADELAAWFPPHVQHLDSALTHWLCKLQHGAKPVVLRVGRKPEAALAC